MTVRELIERQALRRPDAIYACATDSGLSLSYGELARSCRRVAALLQAHGSRPGEVVSLVMPNGLQTLRLLLGAMHGGWCVNPVNLLSQPDQMRYVLSHSDCRIVFTSPEWERRVRDCVAAIGRAVEVVVADPDALALPGEGGSLETAAPAGAELALLMYTSGTTGVPKGVMLTHANIHANILAAAQVLPLGPGDVMIGVLPFFHSFGITATLWLPACLGMGAAFHYSPLDSKRVGELCEEFGGTAIVGTPTFLTAWMRRVEPEKFKTLRYVVAGAEKLRQEVGDAFEQKYGAVILEGYGATELSPLASLNIPDIAWPGIKQMGTKKGSVGQPVPGVVMKVVDPDSGQELPADSPGLLLVKGLNVMKGYLHDEKKTAEVLREGWYVTGDIARIDEDGFVTLTDRLSRFSKIGGEMVPHIRVEEKLHELAGSAEQLFVVAAVPDAKRGERLVVLHKGQDVDALLAKLNASDLPKLWLPDKASFHPVSEFPLLGSGKLDFQKLKAEARRLEGAA